MIMMRSMMKTTLIATFPAASLTWRSRDVLLEPVVIPRSSRVVEASGATKAAGVLVKTLVSQNTGGKGWNRIGSVLGGLYRFGSVF